MPDKTWTPETWAAAVEEARARLMNSPRMLEMIAEVAFNVVERERERKAA